MLTFEWETPALGRYRPLGLMSAGLLSVVVATSAGCTNERILNQTASLGGETAGERGSVDVLFINKTPFRAIFTFGTYDETNQFTQPDFDQFGAGDDSTRVLEGDGFSDIIRLDCGRIMSVGGLALRRHIIDNIAAATFDEAALVEHIYFSSAELGSEFEASPTEGIAAGMNTFLGVDFPCGAMLIFRFEVAPEGSDPPFFVDFEMIPAEEADPGL